MKLLENQFVKVNGIQIHYVTAGEGDLVLLLHGFPQFWYAWRYQISDLAKHFKVVIPDLRGFGQSDKPSKIVDYQSSIIASDIVELIKTLGYEKAYIVGHDWGGGIAWQIAQDHPEVIQKLVVLNCPHPAAFKKALKKDYKQLRRSWYIFFFQIPFIPELILKTFGRSILKSIMKENVSRAGTFSNEDIAIYWKELQKPGALTAALNYYRANFRLRSPQKAIPRKISTPTLVIWGENDSALGKELTNGMEKYFSGPFEIHFIPHCSHWVMEEQPERVNQILLSYFVNNN